jgi:hypothetical protein
MATQGRARWPRAFRTLLGARALPLVDDPRAGAISRVPQPTQPTPIATGDAARRSDLRTSQQIATDQRDGMAEYQYEPGGALSTYTYTRWDARFKGLLVLRPQAVQLGPDLTVANSTNPWRVEYLDQNAQADRLLWVVNSPAANGVIRHNSSGNTWVNVASSTAGVGNLGQMKGFERFAGYYCIAAFGETSGTADFHRSTDGVTWTSSGAATLDGPLRVHDNKLWKLSQLAGSLNFTETVNPESWQGRKALKLEPGELITDLARWAHPSGYGQALYALTTKAPYWYDQDADSWQKLPDWSAQFGSGGQYASGCVGLDDDALYVSIYPAGADAVLQYAFPQGGARRNAGPNVRGGVPAANLFSITHMVSALNWKYAWAAPRAGVSSPGACLARNPQGGWHPVYEGSTANPIRGGGYFQGILSHFRRNGTVGQVWEQAMPDVSDIPQNAVARAYDVGAWDHEYAWEAPTPDIPNRVLFGYIDCRSGETPGLAAGATLEALLAFDGSSSFTSYGTFDQNTTFPVRFDIGVGGVKCLRWKRKLRGARGTATTATPVVANFTIHHDPEPTVRYDYQLRVDLSERAYPPGKRRFSMTATQARAYLEGLVGGAYVAFEYGGGPTRGAGKIALARVKVLAAFEEDPINRKGIVLVTLRDMSTPASGPNG